MASLLGRIFGSDDALAKVVDTGERLLDEAWYTDQEEAADKAAAVTEARGMIVKWMEATEGQRLSRRLIALSITGMWLFFFFVAAVLDTIAPWMEPEISFKIAESVVRLDARAAIMSTAVVIILGFYFSAPFMSDISKAALEKFSKRGA